MRGLIPRKGFDIAFNVACCNKDHVDIKTAMDKLYFTVNTTYKLLACRQSNATEISWAFNWSPNDLLRIVEGKDLEIFEPCFSPGEEVESTHVGYYRF